MNIDVVHKLMKLLYQINPYAQVYRHAREILSGSPTRQLALIAVPRPGYNQKRYNQPTVNEVAMVIEGNGEDIGPRHIILHRNDGEVYVTSDLDSHYFPLRYPLLFPYGEQQWDNLYKAHNPKGN